MMPLPLTVIAGYLGAGKTTFINRLLAGDHGLRLMVLVNDFGAINIDASLVASADEDTIALTNGCVCCTMGADLFMALGDALDRRPRPDHLIVEASGVADPSRIANAALAEPDLAYGGIVTVVDGLQIGALSSDPMIGAQVRDQIACADLLVVSKVDKLPDTLAMHLAELSNASIALGNVTPNAASLLFTLPDAGPIPRFAPHPSYTGWSYAGGATLPHDQIARAINTRPKGLFRLKGIIRDDQGAAWQVQAVGRSTTVTAHDPVPQTQVVAIGLAALVDIDVVETWWRGL